jgi:hypothetical protein
MSSECLFKLLPSDPESRVDCVERDVNGHRDLGSGHPLQFSKHYDFALWRVQLDQEEPKQLRLLELFGQALGGVPIGAQHFRLKTHIASRYQRLALAAMMGTHAASDDAVYPAAQRFGCGSIGVSARVRHVT